MNAMVRRFVRLALAIGAVPVCAVAQDTAGDDEILEEIVVTAQKREESLRDVPLSVEAVLGEKLMDAGILRLDDLKAYVPNLQMTETGIANNIYIRGIGSGLNQGFEQSVSMYQDGVYHGRGHQSRMPFVDLARVEVLRGPQPILFGKNAVAGAVNMIANVPGREFEAFGRVSRDFKYSETTADLVLSGPVTESFRARAAAFHRHSDGYLDNATLGTEEPRRNEVGGRLTLAADLTDSLAATLRVEVGKFDTDGRQIEMFGETPIAAGLPGAGATYSQVVAGLSATPSALNNTLDYVRSGTAENFSNNDSREAALTFDYTLGNGAVFTAVSAFSKYKLDEGCDCDFTGAPLITAGIQEDYKQYSQELRLTSDPGGRFQWIGGLFFQRYELAEHDFLRVPTNSIVPGLIAQSAAPLVIPALQAPGAPCNGLTAEQCLPIAQAAVAGFFRGASNPRDFTQDSTLLSAFAQGTVALNEQWSLTVGGRLSNEDKDGRRNAYLVDAAGNAITNPLAHGLYNQVLGIIQHDVSGSRKETNFSPLVNVQYRPSSASMAYASISQGFKSGGFDARSNKPPAAGGTFEFEDERARTYEVGVKTAVGRKAEINVAAFLTDYKDLQTSAFDGRIGFNVGNGSAEVRGFELEGRWRPFGALLLTGSLATLDFEWKRYQGQCYYDLALTDADGNCDYAGRTNQLAPSFTGFLSAEYGWSLGPLVLTTALDVVHSSSYLQSLNLDPNAKQEAYTKLNARIGLADGDGRWEVAVVGRNLTDKQTVSYVGDSPLALTLFRARSYYGFVDPPRTIAAELRVRF